MEPDSAAAPVSAEDWYQQGNQRQEEGRDDLAAKCYERATELAPEHAQAWNNLGVSRQRLGEAAGAARAYRRALALKPTLLQALANLGHLCRESGDLGGAEPLLALATVLAPADPAHWEALAMVRRQLKRYDSASEAFRAWIRCDPGRISPHVGLAEIAIRQGKLQEAEQIFRDALVHQPQDPMLRHMLAAVRGDSSTGPVEGYVQRLFDSMAPTFDRDLRSLGYRLPEAIVKLVVPTLSGLKSPRVLDLGCGTGLVGEAFRGTGVELTGVDISDAMLQLAKARHIYWRLVQADLVEEARLVPPGSVRVVVAADVFIYLGDLAAVFDAATAALQPDGLFVFSVEAMAEGDFRLTPMGRFTHSAAYLRAQAARCGLTEVRLESIELRRDSGFQVEALLACFKR